MAKIAVYDQFYRNDYLGYDVVGADEIKFTGDYPGGSDRIAFNLARLVLGG